MKEWLIIRFIAGLVMELLVTAAMVYAWWNYPEIKTDVEVHTKDRYLYLFALSLLTVAAIGSWVNFTLLNVSGEVTKEIHNRNVLISWIGMAYCILNVPLMMFIQDKYRKYVWYFYLLVFNCWFVMRNYN